MIIGFKKKFPDGTHTDFAFKMLLAQMMFHKEVPEQYVREYLKSKIWIPHPKIHTLRENGKRYENRTLQLSYGVRTKYYERILETECKSIQEVNLNFSDGYIEAHVDGRLLSANELSELIMNDGLNTQQFVKWFFKSEWNKDGTDHWNGYIIHFTNMKY